MSELKRFEVVGPDGTPQVYELRRWSYEDGKIWLFRLMTLLAKNSGKGGGASLAASDQAAVGELLEDLGEEKFLAFTDKCEGYTNLVMVKDGRETIQPLTAVKVVAMQGRYLDMVMILKMTVEQEFGPFFREIKNLLGGSNEAKGETDTSG